MLGANDTNSSEEAGCKCRPNSLTWFLFLLFLCNFGMFIWLMIHYSDDDLFSEEDAHIQNLLDSHNKNLNITTQADWDVEEKKADGLAYSNLWFVLLIPVYGMLTHSKAQATDRDSKPQLVSASSKLRALLICVLCVSVALISIAKHAFESHSMLPGDPGHYDNDPMADPDSVHNRIVCQLTGAGAFAYLARNERSASYVYSCLPAYWATKLDWFLARVCCYTVPFLAAGIPEMCYVYFQNKAKPPSFGKAVLHGVLQVLINGGLAICICMDIMQMVQETTKSALDQALESVMFSGICIGAPMLIALALYAWKYEKTKDNVQIYCIAPWDMLIRFIMCLLLFPVAYFLWDHEEDKYRYAHVVWHIVSGTLALITLSLCCDWVPERIITSNDSTQASILARTSSKRHKQQPKYSLVMEL